MDVVDLGNGYAYRWSQDGRSSIALRCPHRERSIPLIRDVDDEGWNVVREDPLTLSPSISCLDCGCHGHIVDDRWVPT
jgi:hypothetical protein